MKQRLPQFLSGDRPMAASALQHRHAACSVEMTTMWNATRAFLLMALCATGCAKESAGSDGTAPPTPGAIGVAECDAYVEKMKAFLDTLPTESRAAREPGFKQMQAAWQEAAKIPATKEGLAATCKAQLATLPASLPAK